MNNPYAASNTNMDGTAQQTYEPKIFALHGRIGRIRYFSYGMIINFAVGIFAGVLVAALPVIGNSNNSFILIATLLLTYLPIVASTIILAKRRLNDRDHSGWLSLLFLVPAVNIIFGLYLLFAPGTRGPNNYGAEPCANNTGMIVVACIFPVVVISILAAVAIPAYHSYVRKAKFSEVVLATRAAKEGVELCAQDNAKTPTGTWKITGCAGGTNGVPADITSPNGMVASVTTADNGVITATAITDQQLRGETYILIPYFNDGTVTWAKDGTCKSNVPAIC